jgi:hypothetical protein
VFRVASTTRTRWIAHRCTPATPAYPRAQRPQIDRFLRQEPGRGGAFLDDLFWERRAIAARYAAVDADLRAQNRS